MMIYYKIHYLNEDYSSKVEQGIATSSSTIGDAINQICEYYGEDNIINIEFYRIEDIIPQQEIN